jgi:hypothetical protein
MGQKDSTTYPCPCVCCETFLIDERINVTNNEKLRIMRPMQKSPSCSSLSAWAFLHKAVFIMRSHERDILRYLNGAVSPRLSDLIQAFNGFL